MTRYELIELFEKHKDKYLSGKIDGPRDLAAFNLLNMLVPSNKEIVSCAEHDEFWLSTEPEDLAAVATEDDIIFLVRCGVRFRDGSLSMSP